VVESGVPQGSVLGPTLFLILINDLPNSLSCNSVIFADDTTLYSSRPNSELEELSLTMSNALVESTDWFNSNGLSLNNDKTQSLLFTMCKDTPSYKHCNIGHAKLLGIILDSTLNWSPHIQSVCVRLSRVIFLLRHLRNLLPKTFLKSAYFAFFHSILVYGISLWGSSSHVSCVLKLQKKAIRIMNRSSFNAHCTPLFVAEEILTVVNVYIYVCLCRVKNKFNEFKLRSDGHHHNTIRHKRRIGESFNRLSLTQSWLDSISVKMFNRLPENARYMCFSRYKRVLYRFLVGRPFYNIQEFFDVPSHELKSVFC